MHRLVALFTLVAASITATFAAAPWALVKVAAACLRSKAAHSAELETQATYGTPLRILDRQGEWYRVEMPDGYIAWMTASALEPLTQPAFDRWRKSQRLIVTQPRPTEAFADTVPGSPVAFDVVIGSIFTGSISPGSAFARITTADGRSAYLPAADVAEFSEWVTRRPSVDTVLSTARSMNGITYLWGGTTPKAADCSGFTKIAYGAAGLILPRNASQQALIGSVLDTSRPDLYRPGDLLFFGNTDGGSRITHVAIFLSGTRYIHSSGRVFESSFSPQDPLYLPRKVIKAVRPLSPDSSITSFASHPWYFLHPVPEK